MDDGLVDDGFFVDDGLVDDGFGGRRFGGRRFWWTMVLVDAGFGERWFAAFKIIKNIKDFQESVHEFSKIFACGGQLSGGLFFILCTGSSLVTFEIDYQTVVHQTIVHQTVVHQNMWAFRGNSRHDRSLFGHSRGAKN